MRVRRRVFTLVFCCGAACATGCADRRVELPAGAGTPFPDAAVAYLDAVRDCRAVRTLQATLGLSGRAGSQSLRGSVDAGFEAGNVRLEMRPPFGRPVFILAARGSRATLYLPRDNLVLQNIGAARIVEALIGLSLDPDDLRLLVIGCGFEIAEPSTGREYPGGWLAVETGDSTTYLRQLDGQWRVVAAIRPPVTVQYGGFAAGRPTTIRLSSSGPPAADLTVRVSDVSTDAPLEADVFDLQVPSSAEPMTLEELRRAGPLGDR